ncbi:MAG: DUF2085 domain-containing protein [Methanobacteriota archaeon]
MRRREKCFKNFLFILFLLTALWAVLIIVAPLFFPENSITDLSGVVVIDDNRDITESMGFPWNIVYTVGDRLCHQEAPRSFFLNGNQMPFCSRCTAIFVGLALGLGFIVFYKIELDEKFVLFLILSMVPIGVDGVGQLFGLWESNNIIRVLTGGLVGVFCGIAIGVIRDEIVNTRFSRKKYCIRIKNK